MLEKGYIAADDYSQNYLVSNGLIMQAAREHNFNDQQETKSEKTKSEETEEDSKVEIK